MTHELRRPLLFNVQQTKKPTIGIINQQELAKLDARKRLLEVNGDGYDEDRQQCNASNAPRQAPPVALPLVRSPRPERAAYFPSPSKTPQYFRWKRPPPPGSQKTPNKPMAPRLGPSAPSPRAQRRENSGSSDSTRPPPSLATLQSSSRNLKLFGQVSSELPLDELMNQGEEALDPPSAWQQPSLFYYSDPLTAPPATPKTPGISNILPENATLFQSAGRGQQETKNPSGGALFESDLTQLGDAAARNGVGSSVQASASGSGDLKPPNLQQRIATPASALKDRGSDSVIKTEFQDKPQQRTEVLVEERSPSPMYGEDEEFSGSTGSAFDALASPSC